MASLQARHQRGCALGRPWTTYADAKPGAGCTCKPAYHIVSSLPGGKLERRPVGHVRKDAERALRGVQVEQDQGKYRPLKDATFRDWWDEWASGLRRPNENTRRSYVSTGDYAKRAFGDKKVRALDAPDIERFLSLMVREIERDGKRITEPIAASTQAKHLRVLSSCLREAVRRGYAGQNPIELLGDAHRPQPESREAPYFTDDELPLLLAKANQEDAPLFRLALLTGMRQAELLGLRWQRVNMLGGCIYVREQHTPGIGFQSPKSKRSRRDVELVPAAVDLLGELWRDAGKPEDERLVFPAIGGVPRRPETVVARLRKAIEDAGLPLDGEHLEPPTPAARTFHSLRHTYARIALENGSELTWLSRQLGHSSAAFTERVYGHWSKAARRRETERLAESGAFTF